ncbi:MAG: hypothetical protein Q7Q73_13965 [Verrucomicrobiota bacterium JB024]|nr:hypothetical protein [Verrucomicrobiota bacterium JB024]
MPSTALKPTTTAHAITIDGLRKIPVGAPKPQAYRFTFTAGETLEASSRIQLVGGKFRGVFESWSLQASTLDESQITLVQAPPKDFNALMDARMNERSNQHYRLLVLELKETLPAGESLGWTLAYTPLDLAPLPTWIACELKTPDDKAYRPVGERFAFGTVPGAAARLEVRVSAHPDKRGRHRGSVFVTDAWLNPADTFSGQVMLESEGVSGLPACVELHRGVGHFSYRQTGDIVRIHATTEEQGFSAVSNPSLKAPANGTSIYFGAIHFHSAFSDDGDRNPEDAFAYARDVLNLDVVGLTDHSPIDFWTQTCEANEAFWDEGRFITLPSWEWSTDDGHANLYLKTPEVAAGPACCLEGPHPGSSEWPDDVLLIPHHTNTQPPEINPETGEPYWRTYDWSLRNPRIRAVEMCQTRGSFEMDVIDPEWDIRDEGFGASVADALKMGYRLGFVGGTDNHAGFPTRSGTGKEPVPRYIGMTAFMAPELTRSAIWDALNTGQTYATSGVPIILLVNVSFAGDTQVEVSAEIHGTAPIEIAQIIVNGEVAASIESGQLDVTWKQTLTVPSGASVYLRLRQTDGYMAWSSPRWSK